MGLSHSPSITTDGLVLCLDAANPRSYPGSGNVWTDLSGNSNNITLVNNPTFSGENGGILNFDGTNDYGYNSNPIGFDLISSNAITVEAWVKINPNGYDFWFSSNDIKYRYGTNSSGYAYWDMARHHDKSWGGYVFLANAWYHMCFVGYGTGSSVTSNVYANGVLIRSVDDVGISNFNTNISLFYIGTGESPTAHPFRGSISFIKIYTKALSANEVQRNYLATKSRFGL